MTNYNHYQIEVTTIGPLFIGSGEKLRKKSYIHDSNNRKAHIIDQKKFFEILVKTGSLESYENFMLDSSQKSLLKWIRENKLYSYLPKIKDYSLSLAGTNFKDIRDIELFMKDAQGNPYIPGSSLKGAIMGNIEKSIVGKEESFIKIRRKGMRNLERSINQDVEKRLSQWIDRKVGKKIDWKELSSHILVSDSSPLKKDNLMIAQSISLRPNSETLPPKKRGEKVKLPIFKEYIEPGSKFTFNISLPDKIPFTNIEFPLNIESILLDMDNNYYDRLEYIEDDSFVYSPLEIEGNAALFHLGAGPGFIDKSLIYALYDIDEAIDISKEILSYQFRKHKHDRDEFLSPRVKNMAYFGNKLYPLGLCQATYKEI